MNIGGMNIISNPHLPREANKVSLSFTVDVSPEFRVDTDLWLRDIFGTEQVVYVFDPTFLRNSLATVVCNPDVYKHMVRIIQDNAADIANNVL